MGQLLKCFFRLLCNDVNEFRNHESTFENAVYSLSYINIFLNSTKSNSGWWESIISQISTKSADWRSSSALPSAVLHEPLCAWMHTCAWDTDCWTTPLTLQRLPCNEVPRMLLACPASMSGMAWIWGQLMILHVFFVPWFCSWHTTGKHAACKYLRCHAGIRVFFGSAG